MANGGQGRAVNGREAAQFFLRAALLGHTMAARNFAHILAEGRASIATPGQIESDSDEDDDEALLSGDSSPRAPVVTRRLARILDARTASSGAIRRNSSMALHWFDRAAAAGDTEGGVEAQKLLAREMPRLVFLHQRGSARPRASAAPPWPVARPNRAGCRPPGATSAGTLC